MEGVGVHTFQLILSSLSFLTTYIGLSRRIQFLSADERGSLPLCRLIPLVEAYAARSMVVPSTPAWFNMGSLLPGGWSEDAEQGHCNFRPADS